MHKGAKRHAKTVSNRTVQAQMSSLKEVEKKRRTVFKPLLDNPFPQAQFPLIESSKQAQILEFLLLLLDEVHKFNAAKTKTFTPQKPQCMDHLTTGFNSTVGALEAQARAKVKGEEFGDKRMRYVFVCKSDIQPPLITQQLPTLSYTSSTPESPVKLIRLPRGSMEKIEQRLGTKTGIVGLYPFDGLSTKFVELLDDVDDVKVPWLENVEFKQLKVKMLETTAPIKSKVTKSKVSK